jgi:hypothetical protein
VFDVERAPGPQGGARRLALADVERRAEGVLWIRYRIEATAATKPA